MLPSETARRGEEESMNGKMGWVLGLALMTVGGTLAAGFAHGRTAGPKVNVLGGYETDPRDRGRPVVLVAGGLGVTPEVFREAFSQVRPAPAGQEPDPEQVRRNKDALMSALAKYGVTNDLLDTVSNYYRYNQRRGEMWRNVPARLEAVIEKGKVTGIKVLDPGTGYSSPPRIIVDGHPEVVAKATLWFGKDLRRNGGIAEIRLSSK